MVVGILAAIVITSFASAQQKARDASVQADLKNFYNVALQQYHVTGSFPTNSDTSLNDLAFKAQKASYDVTANNVIYCVLNRSSITDAKIAIVAKSSSGKIFYRSTNGGMGIYTASTSIADYATICAELAGTGAAARYGFATVGGWRSWVQTAN